MILHLKDRQWTKTDRSRDMMDDVRLLPIAYAEKESINRIN